PACACPEYGNPLGRARCKTWNIAPLGHGGANSGRRKIDPMGALRDRHDDDLQPDSFDSDAAALRDLIQEIRAARPLTPSEEAVLFERAAVGDKGSQDRLVGAPPDVTAPLGGGAG